MAVVKKNIITEGLSGKLGDRVVFRQKDGKTIVATTPGKSTKPQSEAQRQRRRKFAEAIKYAKHLLQDPTIKATYATRAKPGQTALNVAISEYLRKS